MAKKINEVERILMERDGITQEEAMELRLQCADALARGELDAIQYYLGLEDDYVFDIFGY